MRIGRKVKVGIAVAGVVAATAVPTAFAVQGGTDDAVRDKAEFVAGKVFYDEGFALIGDPVGEIGFMNEMADGLAAFLADNGVTHSVQTGEVRWVEWDFEDDAANELVGQYLEENGMFEVFDVDDFSDEEIAEITAEADAIKAALDAAGIAYTIETDPFGIKWPIFDEDDPAAIAAVDQVFADMEAEWLNSLSDDERAEVTADMTAEAEAIRAALDAAGIAYTLTTDSLGIEWPEFDENDPAVWDVLDKAFEDLWGDDFMDIPEEELAEIQAEMDDLAAFLDSKGIAYTTETDPSGVTWVEWDWEDEAANQAVDSFYEDRYGSEFFDDLTETDIAEITAEADAIKAALDAAGVTYTVEVDDLGIGWPMFDEDDPAAQAALDQVFAELDQQWLDSLTDDERAEMAAESTIEAAALSTALDAAGIAYTVETDAFGVEWPKFDDLDESAWEIVDQVFEDLYGGFDMDFDEDFDDEDLAETDLELEGANA